MQLRLRARRDSRARRCVQAVACGLNVANPDLDFEIDRGLGFCAPLAAPKNQGPLCTG